MNRSLPCHRLPRRALPALLALMLSAGAQAQQASKAPELPPVYRVELIAFAHVEGDSDRLPAADPADYTRTMDPLLLAAANRYADAAARSMRQLLPFPPRSPETETKRASPFLQSETERIEPIPPAYSALGALSPMMQRALDRLLGSPDHAVLATRTWTQQAEPRRRTPELRLHDQAPVATRSPRRAVAPPWIPVDLHVPVRVTEDGEIRFRRLFHPRPPRLELYRFDGSVRLRRRQFMHLDLDLVWQQRDTGLEATGPDGAPESADGDGFSLTAESTPTSTTAPPAPNPSIPEDAAGDLDDERREWLLHRLVQSRVVQAGRLEYFDSSRFGVLALVQRFEQVVPEPEPEAPATAPTEPVATLDEP